MAALGVARLDDSEMLLAAGAHLVVTNLDQIDMDELLRGHLRRRLP
jgi:hypothetical protein